MAGIGIEELARRLSTVSNRPVMKAKVVLLVEALGLSAESADATDASRARAILAELELQAPFTVSELIAPQWPPTSLAAKARPAVPPVFFSSPGAFDNPDTPSPTARPRRSEGVQHRRPDGRRGNN